MSSLVTKLVAFGLRQVFDAAELITEAVERLTDHSQTLLKALARAHDRAWQALGVSLAGDGFIDRVKTFFASGDDKGIREQIRVFLENTTLPLDKTATQFRQACLEDLKRLRKSGLLSAASLSPDEVAREAAGLRRYTDLPRMVEGAHQAIAQLADALALGYPDLARLLRTQMPGGPPLLAAAFAYFFRREVESDDELAHGLFFDGLRQLAASQAKGFAKVREALDTLGKRFDVIFEQLDRIEAAVLDLQDELRRLGGLHLVHVGEVRSLLLEVQQHLNQASMQRGVLRPEQTLSIRGDAERWAVKALLARFRQLPPEEQGKVPALLNGLGKLQVGMGDFQGARHSFVEVARVAPEAAAQAEAHYNAYRAALEQRRWDEALAAIQQAACLDAPRFEPFPLRRYKPKAGSPRIMGKPLDQCIMALWAGKCFLERRPEGRVNYERSYLVLLDGLVASARL